MRVEISFSGRLRCVDIPSFWPEFLMHREKCCAQSYLFGGVNLPLFCHQRLTCLLIPFSVWYTNICECSTWMYIKQGMINIYPVLLLCNDNTCTFVRDWILLVCFSWRYEATESPRVNFVMREALFEIYTWILCRFMPPWETNK